MTILITGGCGFVGSNLISRLLESGSTSIRVLDNESLGKREWISEFGIDFQQGDIRDEDAVRKALEGVETVVHLAADTRVMDSIENPRHNWDVNVKGTFTLLEAMREMGVRRIVNASTGGAILGEATPPIDESMTASPTSPYGAAKLSVEGYLSAYSGSYGFDAVSLRFSNVYGRRSYHKGSVVATFLRSIAQGKPLTVYGDGSQTRDYIFADELCEGIIKAMQSGCSGVFQLGSGNGTSLNQLIDTIKGVVGTQYNVNVDYQDFRDGEILHTWCNISKANKAFGYAPKTDLDDGIRATWEWFLTQDNFRAGA